jgi:DHA2 family multidrug resistance protein-like MFS transporter
MSSHPVSGLSHRSPWIGLAALCLPMLIASMDVSVLFFAVPFISADLHPSPEQQLWIFDAYGFVLAGLLITVGTIADRFGHRRLLLTGAAAFGAISLLAAYANSAEMLIGARALLGVAGATLMPSSLALIREMFDDDSDRTRAVGIWSAVMASGVAIGPIISGLLLEHFWWGSVFLINLPVMALLLVVGPMLLPKDTGDRSRRVDLLSALLVLAAICSTIHGIKSLAADGVSAVRIAFVVIGLALGAAFVVRQQRAAHPLVDLKAFADRVFNMGLVVNLIAMFGLVGNAILVTQYLQSVLGYSPLKAALWSLAPSVLVGAAAPLAGAAAERFGRVRIVSVGLACAAAGFVVVAAVAADRPLWSMLIGCTMLACGLVIATSLVADQVVSGAEAGRSGATAGLLETTSEFGGALGIAILGSILAAVYHHTYPAAADPAAARTDLATALQTAHGDPAHAAAVIDHARTAFTNGMTVAAIVGAVVLFAVAAGNLALLRRRHQPSTALCGVAAAPE